MLRRPVTTKDIPDHSGTVRHDLLARELFRQAVLIAARDELGLVTRDEVIGDDPVNSSDDKEGEQERVEVVSFIRDLELRERIYRVAKDRVEPLFFHDTIAAGPCADLDLMKPLLAAEALSRQELPGIPADGA